MSEPVNREHLRDLFDLLDMTVRLNERVDTRDTLAQAVRSVQCAILYTAGWKRTCTSGLMELWSSPLDQDRGTSLAYESISLAVNEIRKGYGLCG